MSDEPRPAPSPRLGRQALCDAFKPGLFIMEPDEACGLVFAFIQHEKPTLVVSAVEKMHTVIRFARCVKATVQEGPLHPFLHCGWQRCPLPLKNGITGGPVGPQIATTEWIHHRAASSQRCACIMPPLLPACRRCINSGPVSRSAASLLKPAQPFPLPIYTSPWRAPQPTWTRASLVPLPVNVCLPEKKGQKLRANNCVCKHTPCRLMAAWAFVWQVHR